MEQFNNQLTEAINKLDAIAKPAAQAVQYISDYTKKLNEQIKQVFSQFNFSKFYDNLLAPMKQLALQIE